MNDPPQYGNFLLQAIPHCLDTTFYQPRLGTFKRCQKKVTLIGLHFFCQKSRIRIRSRTRIRSRIKIWFRKRILSRIRIRTKKLPSSHLMPSGDFKSS